MSEINLYKISDIEKVIEKITDKGFEKKNESKAVEIGEGNEKETYHMSLYYNHNDAANDLSWKNFAENFDFTPSPIQSNPRAVIVIEKDNDCYAISFGTAYHYIEPLSDKEWAFDFAKRIKYDKVNLMATTIPQSKRNKQISSYRNYKETDINVGEALNKITAYMESDDGFADVGDKIQASTSLKLNLEKDTLETIAKAISNIENVIANDEVRWDMPHMVEVKDETQLEVLNSHLKEEITGWVDKNQASDLIDVNNYVVYSNDFKNLDDYTNFELRNKRKNTKQKAVAENYNELTMPIILNFINSNNIPPEDVLDITVTMSNENETIPPRNLGKVIVYDCIDENCIYEYGKWSKYNQEYVDMVESEISTIPAKFCPKYSFESEKYDEYLARRIKSKAPEDESYKRKTYTEATFNEYLHECYGYVYYDKDLRQEKGYSVEIMDLYKDGVAYCVKKGSGSSKLSYVVDQCIDGLKYLRRNDPDFANEIKTVCIWLILDREIDIHDENNDANINEINAIILKNRLVQWKQQMRQWGYEPLIHINYKKRENKKES